MCFVEFSHLVSQYEKNGNVFRGIYRPVSGLTNVVSTIHESKHPSAAQGCCLSVLASPSPFFYHHCGTLIVKWWL